MSVTKSGSVPVGGHNDNMGHLVLLGFFETRTREVRDGARSSNLVCTVRRPRASRRITRRGVLVGTLVSLTGGRGMRIMLAARDSCIMGRLGFSGVQLMGRVRRREIIRGVRLSRLPCPSLGRVGFASFKRMARRCRSRLCDCLCSGGANRMG